MTPRLPPDMNDADGSALHPDLAAGILAASPDSVKLLSRDGRLRFMNDRGLELNVLASADDVLGMCFADLWPEEERAKITAAIDGAANGRVTRVEGLCPTATGTPKWWEASFAPFTPAPGDEPMIVGISRDITERRRAEMARDKARRELESRQRAVEDRAAALTSQGSVVWQTSPDLMGVVGRDGIFESVNPAWQALLGWSTHELSTTPFIEFVHPDDSARTMAVFEAAIDRGEPALQFENRYRVKPGVKSGGYRWLSWVAVPEGDKVYCTARDIDGEKQQGLQLAKRTREREAAWELSQDLLMVATLDGTFTAVNSAWARLLGWTEADLLGRNFTELTHPEDLQQTLVVFAETMKTPLTAPYEYRLRHRDDSWHWFAWTAAVEAELVYGNGRETTAAHEQAEALRAAEASLRQSQKMEAVGQLTGGIAHDFNNLLAGISGSLELIRRRAADGQFGDLARYINMGQRSAKRAAALTHRLLAFSRRQNLDPKPIRLNKLVGEMEEMLRRSIGPSIELEVVAAVALWGVVADAGQVENALLNLCLNARDAMPHGGKITVETGNRWIDARTAASKDFAPGQYVSMCVSDNGEGMTAEIASRAFDPFFTTKPIGMGTGLGLSMVYGFAKQSGGQVRIYSEPGKGTMVCVYLPRQDGQESAVEQDASGVAPIGEARGETVLVVDDEPTVRALVVEVLQDLGYATLEAADGSEAIELLQTPGRIDLLVSDVGLPGVINGRQVADAARVSRPRLQVLFITGYAENAVLSHGHLDPGMHVMTKPFELEALGRRVSDLLGSPAAARGQPSASAPQG